MKLKTTTNPLKHFNDLNDLKKKQFGGSSFSGKPYKDIDVKDYSKYPGAAPKPAKLVSPAMKKGGMVKSKKSC
jgi:hypothetical protein